MGACCSVDGGSRLSRGEDAEEWAQWDEHPCRQYYSVLDEIGEGAFSKVVHGRNMTTNEDVALKVVHRLRPGVKPHHWEILHSEVNTLRSLRHPNIIDLKESYEDSSQLVMVLEMLKGGELLEHLKSVKHYSEQKASQLFRQIADAVHFMHDKGYLHRDLKPENVLFVQKPTESPKDELTVKLIDMGMATKFNPNSPVRGAMGTAGFLAPECCHRIPHSPAMDIWSLGMLLFTMLTGRMPYSHSQIERLHYPEIPITKSPGVQSHRFLNLSREAQELLLGMLQHDPIIRMTSREILQHKWVVTEGLANPLPADRRNEPEPTSAPKKGVSIMAKEDEEEDEEGEITTAVKENRSRRNLRAIKQEASKRSLKNLLPKRDNTEVGTLKSKSRFDLMPDDHGSDEDEDDIAPIGGGKSMFVAKPGSRKQMGKKTNRVAAEPA